MKPVELARDLRVVLDRGTRRRCVLHAAGSTVVAGLELVGFALVLPLLDVAAGGERGGAAERIADVTGVDGPAELARLLGVVIVLAFVLKAVAALGFRWWGLGFTFRAEARTSSRLFEAYMRAPYSVHLDRHSSEMVRNVNDSVSAVYSNALAGILAAVTELMLVAVVLGVLASIQPLVTLAVVVYFVAAIVVYQRFVRDRSSEAGERYQEGLAASFKVVGEGLGGIKETALRAAEAVPVAALRDTKYLMARSRRRMLFLVDAPRSYLEVVFIVGVALASVALSTMLPSEDSVPLLGLFLTGGFRILPSLSRLMGSVANVRVGGPAVEIVARDLRELERIARPADDVPALGIGEGILLEDLSFAFPGGRPVVDQITVRVARGSSLAIAGPSGAGKSTLADLLLGLHRPQGGRVLVDDRDIWADDLVRSWQRSIGYVPQDVFLIDASLRDNIVFGDETITESQVRAAVEWAQLGELVSGLSDGLDTEVGERGARLSGGQRQRIGIARALARRPDILVLDEATSSLDADTERRLIDVIEALYGTTTVVMITHRLSTICNVDHIVFLTGGRVESEGSYAELVERSEAFARMAGHPVVALADADARARS